MTVDAPELSAEPRVAMFHAPVGIRLRGVAPGSVVTLEARMKDRFDAEYRAWGTFTADARGEIDPAAQAPTSGTWEGVDPAGFFWSMEQSSGPKRGDRLHELPESTTVTLTALDGDRELARTELERRVVAPDIRASDVREDGLVGRLYLPPGPGPHPGMLVLTGSGGGLALQGAAALASHGYAALALAYFGIEGRPPDLTETPLEYLEAGLERLRARPEVAAAAVGVMGTSKGGELALLLGATYPQLKAIVAYVPSCLVYEWGSEGDQVRSSWTQGGKGLPCARIDPTRNPGTGPPYTIRPGYEAALEKPDVIERASIPVERTQAPILMITGEQDAMWPSSEYADLAMRRLRQHGFRHRYEHLRYPAAGHNIGVPNLPTKPTPDQFFSMGGDPQATARAARESYASILAFLDESLARSH